MAAGTSNVTTAPPTVDEVRSVLATVIDPELGSDIVSLGMVPSLEVHDDGLVDVEIKLTISGCPMRAEIQREVKDRVELHPGRNLVIRFDEQSQSFLIR